MRRLLSLMFLIPAPAFALGQLLPTPDGSTRFGKEVVYLPNGNFVVTDPEWSDDLVERKGAVYLYAAEGTLISRLTGSSSDDTVGSEGITVLANGNFVVRSRFWDAGAATDAGAVTWGHADTGFGAVEVQVAETNSLVGASANDVVGTQAVLALPNGHYVVPASEWDGSAADAGAVAWGNGDSGSAGKISAGNSLIGTHADDHVGAIVTVLANGNYVVTSPQWDTDALANVGAVTLRPADSAAPEAVSANNSMTGSTANDAIGSGGTVALEANVVFASPFWDRGTAVDAGAVTWMPGGITVGQPVGIANSLVGTTTNDRVGSGGLVALDGGNYGFASPFWDDTVAGTVNAGALSRGVGATGSAGAVGAGRSVVGPTAGDRLGSGGVVALPGGNFIAISPEWDDKAAGVADAGSVAWVRGNGGTFGILDGATALRGSHPGDLNAAGATVLANGNYVVRTHFADVGNLQGAGAVTWCPGSQPCAKVIGPTESLVGAHVDDAVGSNPVVALPDGNYVVTSPFVDIAQLVDAGASTWGDGETGVVGEVDALNSLVGRGAGNQVGAFGIFALQDGRYLVQSPLWDRPGANDIGAVTLAPAAQTFAGVVQESNSMWGLQGGDTFGWHLDGRDLGDGRAVFSFWRTSDGNTPFAGAVAVLDLQSPMIGQFDLADATVGGAAQGGALMNLDYHPATRMLLVGDPLANRVWLASLAPAPLPDAVFRDGFED